MRVNRRERAAIGRLLPQAALVVALLLGSAAVTAWADDPDNCLLCHQYRGLGRYIPESDAVHLYFTSPDYQHLRLGAHARIACTDCHERSEVNVIPHKPVSRVDCTRQCHLHNMSGVARRYTHANVADALQQSIHSFDTLAQLEFTDGPLLGAGQSYCLYCHDEPLYRDPVELIPTLEYVGEHVYRRCYGCHADQVPTDTDFYLRHVTSRLQNARPPLEMAQACAVCHSDKKVREKYGLQDGVVRYASTYHGKAALLGSHDTANCINCHARESEDTHLIRSQYDEASISHPDHKADSCRSVNCHPGADRSIGRAAVHLDVPTLTGIEIGLVIAFIIFTMLTFGPSLVLTLLELFQVVIGRHVADEEPMRRLTLSVLRHPEGRRRLRRFTPSQRWQHWLLALLFALLVITGFPMKFAAEPWARHVIDTIGGLAVARHIHHYSGVALVVGFGLHLLTAIVRMLAAALRAGSDGKRQGLIKALITMPMFVGPKDLIKGGQLMAYLLFLRKKPPSFGRFSLDQKFEYLGVFWGTMLLGVTGALLWDTQISSRFVSGNVFNLALIAHTYEAFLAVIHVGILHICNVVFAPQVFPFSPATLTGQTPITRLAEVHADLVVDVAQDLGIEIPKEVSHA